MYLIWMLTIESIIAYSIESAQTVPCLSCANSENQFKFLLCQCKFHCKILEYRCEINKNKKKKLLRKLQMYNIDGNGQNMSEKQKAMKCIQ